MASHGYPPDGPFDVAIPARDLYASGVCCVEVPKAARGLIIAALDGLKLVASWTGENEDINNTVLQVETMISDMMNCQICGDDCQDCDCDTPCDNGVFCGCGTGIESEEDEMAGCVLPYGSLKMVDGVLHYKTCDGFIPVPGWETDVVVDPPSNGDDPTEDSDYGCNKAAGMAGLFTPDFVLLTEELSSHGATVRPWVVRATLPQYNISNAKAKIVAQKYNVDSDAMDEMAANPDLEALLRCSWAPAMLDTSTLTITEFLAMLSLNNSNFDPQEVAYINAAADALGYGVFSWWAGAFFDTEADCDCPAQSDYDGPITFQDSRSIDLESQGATLDVATQELPEVMYFEVKGGQNENYQEVHWSERLVASGDIQELQVEYPLESADVPDYYPAKDWTDTNPTPTANYHQTKTIGPAPTTVNYYPSPNKQVVIMKWASPTDLDAASLDFGIKMNPKDQSPDRQTYKFRAKITYSGDLR